MAEQVSPAHESQYGRIKEHLRHVADRVWHSGLSNDAAESKWYSGHSSDAADSKWHSGHSNDAAESNRSGFHVGTESRCDATSNIRDAANYNDFPFDSSRLDPFTAELASVADDDDGIISPKSQSSVLSFDTMNSSASGQSWTSNQRTIGGFGIREGRPLDQLGPYKSKICEEVLEAVPTDYQDYVNEKNPSHETGPSNDTAHLGRSSSTSSEQSVPDSLYADLLSISNREFDVPDGLLKSDGFDSEGSTSPRQTSHVGNQISNLKLQDQNH